MNNQKPPKPPTKRGRKRTPTEPTQIDFEKCIYGQNIIKHVQRRIEDCLVKHMTKRETILSIARDENIDRNIIIRVWQLLEEENADFFRAYWLRMRVMRQIETFNELLQKQHSLVNEMQLQNIMPPALNSMLVNPYMEHPAQQLPSFPSATPTPMESSHNMTLYRGADEVLAAGNSYPIQQNM